MPNTRLEQEIYYILKIDEDANFLRGDFLPTNSQKKLEIAVSIPSLFLAII